MLGGACLIAGPKPAPAPPAVTTTQSADKAAVGRVPPGTHAGAQAAMSAQAARPAGLAASLRDRFHFPSGQAARPFAFARVAEASTDQHCLAETVYFEARGESADGQKAVAQVVLNRVRHPAFPKTICGVVHQRTSGTCQFSFACSNREAATDSVAWRRAQTIASAALHGAVMAAVGDATHFQTARSGSFAGLMKVAQVGAHVFYRFTGRAGATAMFRQAPSPSADVPRVEVARLEPSNTQAASFAHLDLKTPPAVAAVAPTSSFEKSNVVAVKLGSAPISAPSALVVPAFPAAPAAKPKAVSTPPKTAVTTLTLAQF